VKKPLSTKEVVAVELKVKDATIKRLNLKRTQPRLKPLLLSAVVKKYLLIGFSSF
jgi:hypothetical protein